MKRLSLVYLLFLTTLLLSSCRVNWFDKSYDVPWWVVGVPVALVFVLSHIYCVTRTYKCPRCGTEFRAKWYDISTWYHMGWSREDKKRVAKCPHCKRRGFCRYGK